MLKVSALHRMKKILNLSAKNINTSKNYEEAIFALNSLQSNTAALNASIKLQEKHNNENSNLKEAEKFFLRTGLTLRDLNKLSVIHIAGSKGKGSTCAYTEAILNEHNYKTGLFTSPHLISVTERIKLAGQPISKQLFTDYFWKIYNMLDKKKENDHDLPSYFKFLTILAYYIFVKEKVDVAIIEVGIGGEHDCTNILRNTEVVGITSLHLEHTQLLGNTMEEIAWQKAGIIKESSSVFTMPQPENCLKVIEERTNDKKASLSIIPNLSDYKWFDNKNPNLGVSANINQLNVSMAIQLADRWMQGRFKRPLIISDHYVDEKFAKAINKCVCLGRFQKLEHDKVKYFFDGAHTVESIQICVDWFKEQVLDDEEAINVLIYNSTGDRNFEMMLQTLHAGKFHKVFFTTNYQKAATKDNNDNFTQQPNTLQLERCLKHKEVWDDFSCSSEKESSYVCGSINEALNAISAFKTQGIVNVNVLVTGSLHLVGNTLGLIL